MDKAKPVVISHVRKRGDNAFFGGRAQSGLEYILTYGWSILVIIAVVAILYSLNAFNVFSFLS